MDLETKICTLLSRAVLSKDMMMTVLEMLRNQREKIDYDRLLSLASYNQVTPIIHKHLEAAQDLPDTFVGRIRMQRIATLQRSARQLTETLRVIGALHEGGMPVIPLKGPLMAETLLGDISLYSSSDIDLLVRTSDIGKAISNLENAGYRTVNAKSKSDVLAYWYNLALTGPEFTIELHWNITVRYFPIDPDFWWEDAGEATFQGRQFNSLSKEKLLISLVLNIFKHRFRPLKIFLPVQVLIGDTAIDWEKFLLDARRIRAERLMVFCLQLMNDLFDIPLPGPITKKKIAGYDFLKRQVLKGLFAEQDRPYQHMLSFIFLLDSPAGIMRFLAGRTFPPVGEVRLRYNIPRRSPKVIIYYLLNPFIVLLGKPGRM